MVFNLLLMTNAASLQDAYDPNDCKQHQGRSDVKWDLYHKKLPRQDTMGVCMCLIKICTDEGREHASEKRA